MQCEAAKQSDAREIATLINLAGEGLPFFLWAAMADSEQSPLDVGELRAARSEGDFSYNNAMVIRDGSQLAGMILAYRLPNPYEIDDLNELPPIVRPLVELEATVAGSWYINALATKAEHRGQGIGQTLIEQTSQQARVSGAGTLSLIVDSNNRSAKSLYEFLGFEQIASQPIVPWDNGPQDGQWQLMIKTLSA